MLYSSSKGNCAYIKYKNDEFLIDCGASARSIEDTLKSIGTSLANLSAIFITHEHSDHIKGMRILASTFRIPVYASEGTITTLEQTGQLNWPVPVLSIAGLLLFSIGWAMLNLGKKEEETV